MGNFSITSSKNCKSIDDSLLDKMKNLNILLLFSLGLLLACCTKDEGDLNLTSDFLEQTSWTGIASNAGTPVALIGIEFTSKTNGHYTYQDMESENDGDNTLIVYQVDKKKVTFNIDPNHILDPNRFLVGNWFLVEKNNNRLVFKQNLYSENQQWALELNKVY